MSRIEKLNRELERVYLQGMDLDGNIHNVAEIEIRRNYIDDAIAYHKDYNDPRMKFSEYQQASNKTRNREIGMDNELANYSLGLVCEAGEVGDILKKMLFHGHNLDRDGVIKEMGDVLWYMSNICNILNIKLSDVARINLDKLDRRYPNGFSCEDSMNRKE